MALLWPYATLATTNWWISMDQGWIKVGHIQGDGLVPFIPPEIVIWGPYRGPKWPKLAINGAFLAKSAPGVTSLPEARSAMQWTEKRCPSSVQSWGKQLFGLFVQKMNFCQQKNAFLAPKGAILGNRGHKTAPRAAEWAPTGKLKVSKVTSGYGEVMVPLNRVRLSARKGG